jgi:hypothetical protein
MMSSNGNLGSVADPGCFIPDPRSGSLNFSSRIRIPVPGGKKSTGSWVLLYIKRGKKNKTNLFLASNGFRNKFY